jgi:hypothetical protein
VSKVVAVMTLQISPVRPMSDSEAVLLLTACQIAKSDRLLVPFQLVPPNSGGSPSADSRPLEK